MTISNKLEKSTHILTTDGPSKFLSKSIKHFKRKTIERLVKSHIRGDVLSRKDLKKISNFYILVGQDETVEFNSSTPVQVRDETVNKRTGTYTLDQPFVCEVSNTSVIGENAVTVTSDGKYILENSTNHYGRLVRDLSSNISTHLFSRTEYNIKNAISLVGPHHTNYYHWFVDYLQRIRGLKAYEEVTGRSPTVLIESDPPEWKKTSLQLMNCWDQILEWKSDRADIDKMVVPTMAHVDRSLLLSPARLNWLREKVLNSSNNTTRTDYSPHIYISREDARSRRVHNESEVLGTLPDAFERYELSNLSLVEQINLFSRAKTVVAPHGAGLTNMLWGSNIKIIEFRRIEDPDCFYQMANALDHSYEFINCDSIGNDIFVNIQDIPRIVR